MAKNDDKSGIPGAESFMDMFSQFGKNLNVPKVDVESILSHHRRNLEALQKAASANASGANEIMAKQRAALQEGLQEITEMAQNFRAGGGNAQDVIAKQADFARKSFETAVKNAGEVGEIMRKTGSESVEILRDRIKTAMEEIRDVYEKKS